MWDTWVERAYLDDMQPYGAPRLLHHYVRSYESLMSILASQRLWASDVSCLRDTTEFRLGVPTCLKALKLIRSPYFAPHVRIIESELREKFRHRAYVACLSTSNDLRSQWENYADEDRGYAITFEMRVLSALDAPLGLRVMPVEYGHQRQLMRARRAVRRAIEDLDAILPRLNHAHAVYAVRTRFTLLAAEFYFLCISFKRERFRRESEWRIIYTRPDDAPGALPVDVRKPGIAFVSIDLTARYAQQTRPTFAAVRAGPRSDPVLRKLVRDYVREALPKTKWDRQRAL